MNTLFSFCFNVIGLLLAIGLLCALFRLKEGQISVLIACFVLMGIGRMVKANKDKP